jgi:hypothetical protein
MKRVLVGILIVPLLVACVAENATAPPPPPPPPPPAETATATSTSTSAATPTPTATETETADAGPPPADAGPYPSDDGGTSGQYRACTMDGDCVAVARVGCCNNGWKEAVAASQQGAYAASFTCPQAHPICPQYRVLDSRVALCDNATHLCKMEKPEDIHCDGFVRNAHKCPAGYTCPRSKVPDVASICVKSP